jgi:hypothetical protein
MLLEQDINVMTYESIQKRRASMITCTLYFKIVQS